MAKLYVPNYSNGKCAYLYNHNTIRVYDSQPNYNTTVNYTDYYLDMHYYSNTGSTTFNQYSNLPVCLSSSNITDDILYRVDIDSIMIIFLIMCIFVFYIPLKVLLRLFKRFRL